MGCHALLQGVSPTQGSNLHWQVHSLPLSHKEPQGAITSLILKMTKIGTERLIHLSKFTQLAQNGATPEPPILCCLPQGDS